jgi:hypothetical protein
MRAPQYGKNREKMPVGPNPAIAKGPRVAPFANIFALVESLGVISLHKTEADAKTALEAELERRRQLRKTPSGEGGEPALARPQANEAHDAKAER